MHDNRYTLSVSEIPDAWYNLAADLPEPIPPHCHPRTGEPVQVDQKFVPFFKTGKELRERLNKGNIDLVSSGDDDPDSDD